MTTLIRYQATHKPIIRKTEQQLRQEIIQVCKMLWQKGFVAATDGNVSARLDDDRFLCTPSGFSKGLIEPDQLIVIDWDVQPVGSRYGPARDLHPTSEMLLHLEAYRQRPDVQAVVHAHPPTAIALSIAGIDLERCFIPDVVLSLGMIPTTDYATPASGEGATVITELIKRYDALILRRHGSITVGTNVIEAYLRLEKLEQTATIAKHLVDLGREDPFPATEAQKLVDWRVNAGLMRPGQAEDLCEFCGVCHGAGEACAVKG